MKPYEQNGVVDERLNVYGVQNLKIAGNLNYLSTILNGNNPHISLILLFRLQHLTRECRS